MGKRLPLTDPRTLRGIRRLASSAEDVYVTKRAQWDMFAGGLTKADVCEAICDWINSGEQVMLAITDKATGHIGELVFEMYPVICGEQRFVKVAIQTRTTRDRLFIISAHPYIPRGDET